MAKSKSAVAKLSADVNAIPNTIFGAFFLSSDCELYVAVSTASLRQMSPPLCSSGRGHFRVSDFRSHGEGAWIALLDSQKNRVFAT